MRRRMLMVSSLLILGVGGDGEVLMGGQICGNR